ncbi:MAG: type IV pilus assembly protein PilM [Armatimonadetes bacterium]|nr:type IV pilus assembly protein PilM [Armatimonadota bacterium]
MSPSRNPKPSAVVGLDIGSDLIKVAEAKYGKDGISITGLGVAPTPAGVIENEVIVDPKALGAAIKALLAENGIKTKKSVSSVAGQSRVVVRVIEVPKMSGKELAETMKWEVERHVPFPPNEVVMDFQPLDKPNADPNAQNMDVLLAVAQQELIDTHVQTLTAAGLKPTAIDIEALAASRSLVEVDKNGSGGGEVVAIVNIGCNNTDLSIFEDGILTFPSPPLGIAGVSFTREIAEAMGQTLEQAEITKREYAAVNLDAFDAGSGDQGGFGAPAASEPTSFDTAVGPQADAPFDLGEDLAPAPQAPAEPTQFQSTVDGPVFDIDPLAGASFGVGDQAAPASPAFDFGSPQQEEEPAPGQVFDFGGSDSSGFDLGAGAPAPEAASPVFDLGDDEPAPPKQEEPASPSFDLSDADEAADPGDKVAYMEPVAAPKAAPGGSDSIQDQVFQAISGVLMDLATELRRSLEYYSTKYSKTPSVIYLCGGTAKMPKLDVFLSRELGVPVVVADPVKKLQVKVPQASPQYLKDMSPLFSVCIGLAIRDMIG